MPRAKGGSSAGIEKAVSKLGARRPLRPGSRGESVAALQDYLLKYGFLVPEKVIWLPPIRERVAARESGRLLDAYADLAAKAISSMQQALQLPKGQFDTQTAVALKNLQRFHGLEPSGVLDEGTREFLKQPRYDHHPDVPLYAVAAQWDHTDLTYQFVNGTKTLPDSTARAVVSRGFQTWQNASKLTFREIPLGQPADIRVSWARRDHGDGYPFDGPWGVLAHGFFPSPRGERPGDLHFDEDERWCDDPNCSMEKKEGDLVTVAAHEIGHCLGLDHSRDRSALMYSGYGGPRRDQTNPDLAGLGTDDIEGVKALYP